jgi:Uma2 family endonuclease
MSLSTSQEILTDTWIKASWDDFVAVMDAPEYEAGRGYFDNGLMRLEMAPLGPGHGRQNGVVIDVLTMFAALNNIRLVKLINCSFYKAGERGCQPDTAFYIGADFQLPPQNNSPIDINVYGPPTLAIELGASSFKDDLGAKRLLYERLGVREYWVINVEDRQVTAFSIADRRSGEIRTSEVLPGLDIAQVEEALARSQSEDDAALMRWLMTTLHPASTATDSNDDI